MQLKKFSKLNLKKIIVFIILFCVFNIFLFISTGQTDRIVGEHRSGTFHCPFLDIKDLKFYFLIEFGTFKKTILQEGYLDDFY